MEVRPARSDDEATIGALHARCVGDAFAGLLGSYQPPEAQQTERMRTWAGPLGAPHPRHALFVAQRGARAIGFTAVGPTRDDDDDRLTTGELRVLMVDADERGRGVGPALIAAGERAMRDSGFVDATLWVVPDNLPAVRCYERLGWRPDGAARPAVVDERAIPTVRYRKQLRS